MKYTDLRARLDYLSSPDAEHMPDGARLTSIIRCAVEAAAAIDELEAQAVETAVALRKASEHLASLKSSRDEGWNRAEAAEARVAELLAAERERCAQIGGEAAVTILLRKEPNASHFKQQMVRQGIANPIRRGGPEPTRVNRKVCDE